MHADSANSSTIGGITAEFFERVLAHYPPAPPPGPPAGSRYGCVAQRCVQLDETPGGTADPKCAGQCPQLAPTEWLAV